MYGWGGQREPFSSTMWVLGTNRISQDWSHFEGLETFFFFKKKKIHVRNYWDQKQQWDLLYVLFCCYSRTCFSVWKCLTSPEMLLKYQVFEGSTGKNWQGRGLSVTRSALMSAEAAEVNKLRTSLVAGGCSELTRRNVGVPAAQLGSHCRF